MSFDLTILGSSSAKPCFGRFTTSQFLQFGSEPFIIDAGEGIQIQLAKYGLKTNKLRNIFISHLHGDHILGLPGLLGSFSLGGRSAALTIYAPPGLEDFISTFIRISGAHLNFPLDYVVLDGSRPNVIYKSATTEVTAFPVKHRVPTYGFFFKECVKEFKIKSECIAEYNLEVEEIKAIKQGHDLKREELHVDNHKLVIPKTKPKSYAFCADTLFTTDFISLVKEADLLYHEATYLKDLAVQAEERMHSTAEQAAKIASLAEANRLIIGHYSSRYKDLKPLLLEAQEVFANTVLAIEGELHSF